MNGTGFRIRVVAALIGAASLLAACSGDTALPAQVEATLPATTTTVAPEFEVCSGAQAQQDATPSYAPTQPLPQPC